MPAYITKRFGYLDIVLWLFVEADDVDGAREILRQWRVRPPADHDPVTRESMEAHEDEV